MAGEIGQSSEQRTCWPALGSPLSSGPKGPKGSELVMCFGEKKKKKVPGPFLLHPVPYQIPCSVSWGKQLRDLHFERAYSLPMGSKLLAQLPILQQGNVVTLGAEKTQAPGIEALD